MGGDGLGEFLMYWGNVVVFSLVVCIWVFVYLLNYFIYFLIWLILKIKYGNRLEIEV